MGSTKSPPVRVLESDRELADLLDDDEFEAARARLVARSAVVEPGCWAPPARPEAGSECPGLLVLGGMLCREVRVGDSVCAELVGPGDVVRPWAGHSADGLLPYEVRWQVLTEARLALLGPRFMSEVSRWPALATALVSRSIDRSQKLALSAAISSATGLPQRLLMLFRQLADRWGRVRSDGVVVPVPLTHELISRLVGARRPSVSTVLKQLEREGQLAPLHSGGWLLAASAQGGGSLIGSDDSVLASTG